jgi:hypothetical protein
MSVKEKLSDGKILVSTRLSPDLHGKIEQHRQELSATAGGAFTTFSFALAHLVQRGIDSSGRTSK